MSDTKATWRSRVAAWRASGKTAEEFSASQGFAVGTLRWWSSRLGREGTPASVANSDIRLAKVVRSIEPVVVGAPGARGAVVIEMHDGRVRVLVEAGVDRATLSTVLELVGVAKGKGECR
jgi:tRNA threonylcarbamoyladenosine modification (KEOPS) complex  Pcc1 subunit